MDFLKLKFLVVITIADFELWGQILLIELPFGKVHADQWRFRFPRMREWLLSWECCGILYLQLRWPLNPWQESDLYKSQWLTCLEIPPWSWALSTRVCLADPWLSKAAFNLKSVHTYQELKREGSRLLSKKLTSGQPRTIWPVKKHSGEEKENSHTQSWNMWRGYVKLNMLTEETLHILNPISWTDLIVA